MLGNVIQIHSVPAKIDISSVSARIGAHSIPSKLDIEKIPSKLEIHTRNIQVQIDNTECFAEEGHKTISMLIKEKAEEGMQAIKDYTHELSVEAYMYNQAEKGEDVLKELAQNYVSGEIPDVGIKFIPSHRPKITWIENSIKTDWQPAKYICNWTVAPRPAVSVERLGSVTITEVQKPELHIEYLGYPEGYHILDKLV